MPMVHHPIHKTKGLCYLIIETNPTLFFKIFLQFLVHKAKRFSYLLIKQGVSYAHGAPPPPAPKKLSLSSFQSFCTFWYIRPRDCIIYLIVQELGMPIAYGAHTRPNISSYSEVKRGPQMKSN